MLSDQTAKELRNTVLKRLDLTYLPDEPGANLLSRQFAEIASWIAVLTLQEYEKLRKNQDS